MSYVGVNSIKIWPRWEPHCVEIKNGSEIEVVKGDQNGRGCCEAVIEDDG